MLSHGVLTREAYDAIWALHEAGLRLVAVTGRPSGWGEVIARQWPIDGAVTENGAVHVVREGKGVALSFDGDASRGRRAPRAARRARARRSRRRCRTCSLADDVHARRSDVAWDIGERERLEPSAHRRAREPRRSRRARARRALGAPARDLRARRQGERRDPLRPRALRRRRGRALHRWAFVGDSGNDAACFAAFKTTFGVANVRAYARVAERSAALGRAVRARRGFAEIAKAILASRW